MVETVQELLNQLSSETLDDLLQRHRGVKAPAGPLFLPQLDAMLGTTGTLPPGSVYELVGGPKSGKSQFLYFLALTAVLPYEWIIQLEGTRVRQEVIELGGRDRSILVVGSDFDMVRVVHLMKSHVNGRLGERRISAEDVMDQIDDLIWTCCKNIHIFQPTSVSTLINTLQSIPQYMKSAMEDRFVFILIDALGQFYWSDRALLETSNARDKPTLSTAYGIKTYLIPALEAIQKLGLVTFITNWDVPSKESNMNPHLITTWWKSSTCRVERLNFARAPIGQFPHDHSLTDALRDEEKWRSKIVDKGKVLIRKHLARADVPSVELDIQEYCVRESND